MTDYYKLFDIPTNVPHNSDEVGKPDKTEDVPLAPNQEVKKVKPGEVGSIQFYEKHQGEAYKQPIYVVYKITNMVNGYTYIGQHKTLFDCDTYSGSGTFLRWAQSIYGLHNFKKEILVHCDNQEEADYYERLYVNDDFVERTDTYNIVLGGRNIEDRIQRKFKPVTGEFEFYLRVTNGKDWYNEYINKMIFRAKNTECKHIGGGDFFAEFGIDIKPQKQETKTQINKKTLF